MTAQDPVQLSRKAAINFNKTAAAAKLLSLLNISSCWKVVVSYHQRNVHDKLRQLPCLFRDFLKYKTFVLHHRPYFLPVRAEVTILFLFKKTN